MKAHHLLAVLAFMFVMATQSVPGPVAAMPINQSAVEPVRPQNIWDKTSAPLRESFRSPSTLEYRPFPAGHDVFGASPEFFA